jgi:hypothetical protein
MGDGRAFEESGRAIVIPSESLSWIRQILFPPSPQNFRRNAASNRSRKVE